MDVKTIETYILRHANDLSINERREILKIINDSNVPDRYIRSKGSGTEIPLKYVPEDILLAIHNYISTKIADKQNALQSFPDTS